MDNLKSEPNQNESPKKSNSKSLTPVFTIISSHTRKTYGGSEHPSKRWGHSVILYNKSMIIFGGRHLQRSLSNIYSLDFTTLTWAKIDPNCNPPPARDSHSAVLYNNSDMIIFGGNGSTGKLNDLWNFNFNDKKWNKIITEGPTPSARDGHLSSLIYRTLSTFSFMGILQIITFFISCHLSCTLIHTKTIASVLFLGLLKHFDSVVFFNIFYIHRNL